MDSIPCHVAFPASPRALFLILFTLFRPSGLERSTARTSGGGELAFFFTSNQHGIIGSSVKYRSRRPTTPPSRRRHLPASTFSGCLAQGAKALCLNGCPSFCLPLLPVQLKPYSPFFFLLANGTFLILNANGAREGGMWVMNLHGGISS